MSGNIIFYEYYGLPGSGKTTLLKGNNSSSSFYISGAQITGVGRRTLYDNKIIKILKSRPISLYLRTMRLCKKYRLDESVKNSIRAAQVLAINMSNWASKEINATVINDNGFAQILVSILKRKEVVDADRFVDDYLNLFFIKGVQYHFIFVNTSPETCYERIIARGKKLSITESGIDTIKELHREKILFEFVTKRLIFYFENDNLVSFESEENN